MEKKSFGQEFAEEVFCKAVHSAVPIAAAIAMGPVGIAVGVAAAVAIAAPGYNGSRSVGNSSESKKS